MRNGALNAELSERVMQMIADQTARRLSRLRPETDLFQDLGVDGDDALELLVRLRDEFAINMDDVQFKRHFSSEPHLFSPWLSLSLLLPRRWRWPLWRQERIPVTVADLIEAARTQTWPIGYDEQGRSWSRPSTT
jgi:acyl carrier protein